MDYTITVTGDSVVGTLEDTGAEDAEIVILYTNDIHGAVSSNIEFSGSSESLGFAGLAAVKSDAEEEAYVTLVDDGDADQGSVVTSESDGKDVQDLMADIGYDLYIPGNHEFDYGMDAFLEYAEANGKFLSCNFVDNRTGEPVLNTHTVYTYDVNGQEFKIGFIGISTPETIAKSTPTYFQDEEGNYIYGFDVNDNQDLYDDVQEAADACRAEGADMVIALSHLGDTGVESDWSSFTVASETTGIDVFLDGHAHSFLPGEIASNKDGEDVLITSTGTKLVDIGVLTIDIAEDGAVTVTSNLVNEITEDEQELDAYNAVAAKVQEIEDGYAYLVEVKGSTDFDLVVNDPVEVDAEGNPIRIIRTQETNLADLITDAYRDYFGADIGIMNGGSIRATIAAGDIQYNSILAVMPWNSEVTLVEMSGATLVDMLEMGAHLYPEECGGFIHGSNLEYTIDSTIPSSVEVNSDGEFVAVNGDYRVKDVKVGGKPVDPEAKYTVAINSYYSEDYGDGMTMLKDAAMITRYAEDGEPYYDHDVFITYLESFENSAVPEEYADFAGQGRLTILTEEDETALAEETEALE